VAAEQVTEVQRGVERTFARSEGNPEAVETAARDAVFEAGAIPLVVFNSAAVGKLVYYPNCPGTM